MNITINEAVSSQVNIEMFYEDQMPENLMYLKGMFEGKAKELYTLVTNEEVVKYTLLIGLGKEAELTQEIVRNAVAKGARRVRELKLDAANIKLVKSNVLTEVQMVEAVTDAICLGLYAFDKYKTDKQEASELKFSIQEVVEVETANRCVKEREHIAAGINMARDIINEPSNVLYPETLANIITQCGKESGFEVEVLEGEALEKLGMDAMLTVGNGSVNKPRLIVMRHMNAGDEEIFGLVGKGLTCDTGGYSLKHTDSMYYQKTDMSGAASVLGTMIALAKNNVKKNVIGVIPACENVVSGCSYKVGDVLTTMAGKTVQVLNTDAEGRLALADAITYIIREEKVGKLLDLATLTGVAGVTFGNVYTAAISNNDAFYNEFLKAAEVAEEKFWRLPTDARYREWINSDVADIKNTGAAGGGTITAAMFLQEFVEEHPWIHLDIAATACVDPAVRDYEFRGGTGVAIRTLYELINN
ncbi:MAG: leucyl aminopeptidase [Zhenhengia sp.]|uniref:Probable cytosol aminopeptidase n=1 Tax=Zhenhengia yiwuensis TaxID=2763666 RepID=A0A926EIE0_9FIRM|nr:leucyl aminopeptidase [Zhenhengia yiwuensis]MBC8578747.1 leucyl aminopeptidase [Zhenhengia yiwuensis]MBP3911920.1 leucyl aminopeptidase [Niameybacter sp.]MBS5800515.1 leucyl aminopeptidase [Clostridiales bacterium]MDU6358716.1 leucyl aminopeptidase [Clostridiales bacterium]